MTGLTRRSPKWARHQVRAAWFALVVSIAMFVIVGLGWEPFNRPVDFGILPLALLVISIYVLFGVNVLAMLQGAEAQRDAEEAEEYKEAYKKDL